MDVGNGRTFQDDIHEAAGRVGRGGGQVSGGGPEAHALAFRAYLGLAGKALQLSSS